MKVAPSVICADFTRLGEEIRALEAAGADLLHIDVMDGVFVPNITLGPFIVEAIRSVTDLPLDTHLMLQYPERYVERFALSGANIITVPVETTSHLHRTIEIIRSFDVIPGVVINPTTPLTFLEYVLEFVEMVTVMGVNPGFAGQALIPSMLAKVEALRKMVDSRGLDVQIQFDGGTRPDLVPALERVGVDIVVGGASVFLPGRDYRETIASLRGAEVSALA